LEEIGDTLDRVPLDIRLDTFCNEALWYPEPYLAIDAPYLVPISLAACDFVVGVVDTDRVAEKPGVCCPWGVSISWGVM
jgi:hypothetical protein